MRPSARRAEHLLITFPSHPESCLPVSCSITARGNFQELQAQAGISDSWSLRLTQQDTQGRNRCKSRSQTRQQRPAAADPAAEVLAVAAAGVAAVAEDHQTPPPSTSASFTGLQKSSGWSQFGQGPPNFVDCSPSPCDGISFSMSQGISSPSLSGSAGEFYIGGSVPYSDALFNNHLIGPLSTQGKFDPNRTLVPSLHNFTYDVYFYGANLELAQALEFDVNQFFDNMGFIFGHECRIAGGNQWDVWDNQNAKWVPTGVPCFPNSNEWNHVTIQMQRTSGNELVYQSITLNGKTSTLNWTFGHGSSPGWKGITINYQMDGNYRQDSYKVYLDNLTFTYN